MHSATKIKEKLGERLNHIREAQKLVADANSEERVMTAEERESHDTAWAEAEKVDEIVRQWEDENRIERDIAASQARMDDLSDGDSSDARRFEQEIREGLLAKNFNREFNFRREDVEKRVSTAATSAGALIPEDFVARVYEARRDYSALLNCMPEIIPSMNGAPLPYPMVSTVATATDTAEGAKISTAAATQPVFTAVTLHSYKVSTLIPVTFELLRDEGVNLTAWLAGHMGRALAYKLDDHFINGDGSSKPTGIFSTGTGINASVNVGVTLAADNAPTWKEVKELEYSVPGGYVRSGASSDMLPATGMPCWLMRRSLLGSIFALADTNNYPIFRARISEMAPDMLDGYRVSTTDQVSNAAATGTKVAGFGNFFDAMTVREVNSIRFDTDSSVYFEEDMVAFRAIVEVDSLIKDRNAVKAMANP